MKSTALIHAALILLAGCAAPLGPRHANHPSDPHGRGAVIEPPRGAVARQSPAPGSHGGVVPVAHCQPVVGPPGCPPPAPGCPPSAPHGYALPAYHGWNRYGTDPQEFLCDGGDQHGDVILRRDDRLAGLDPADTVVHYTTEAGDIHIEASNRVCLYAPRFGSVRRLTGALAGGRAVTASQVDRPQGPIAVDQELPGLVVTDTTQLGHADVARRPDAMRERNRGVPVEGIVQPEQADEVLAALAGLTALGLNELQDQEKLLLQQHATAAVTWSLDEALEVVIKDLKPPTLTRDEQVAAVTIYEFPDAGRLRICKLADRDQAQPGEIVRFSIQVVNVGDSPVSDVTITDNLVTRLEYVPNSQTASVGAEFLTEPNAGESLRLQWKLTDTLKVGETATIRFRCRVR